MSNDELLEEERVKAKEIRERMAGVVGGSYSNQSSSGYGYGGSSSGYGNTGGYGGYGSKESKKKEETNYNYGNTLGHFGNYSYEKSTIDKYK